MKRRAAITTSNRIGIRSTPWGFDGPSISDSGPVYRVLDTYVDAPGTLLTAHPPDIDEVGAGWQNAGWSGAGRVIAGDVCSFNNWPNHGRNVIDGGIANFDLRCILTIKNANYVGLQFSATGFGIGNFTGYSFCYQAGSNRLILCPQYPGFPGTLGTYAIVLDETGATPYVFQVIRDGANMQCFLDGLMVFDVNNAVYQGTYCGIPAWSDDGGTWDDFMIIEL